MTTVKTDLAPSPANRAPFAPTADIPRSTIQRAIEYLADTTLAGYLRRDQNLADLTDVPAARNNLGLPAVLAAYAQRANNLADLADAAAARVNLSLVPGVNVQAYDADLAALGAAGSAADRLPYYTGTAAAALTPLTALARSLLSDASESTMRATLGVTALLDEKVAIADLASLTDVAKGAAMVGRKRNAVGSYGRTLADDQLAIVWVMDFVDPALRAGIRDGTNTTDLKNYIAAAWTHVLTLNPRPMLVFEQGVWVASEYPNFAVQNAFVTSTGTVRLRYTGTSHAIYLDGGTSANGVNSVRFGPFIIEAPSTALDGLRAKNVHRSTFDHITVRGCGTTSYGISLIGCVCPLLLHPKVSALSEVDGAGNGGWYLGATPLIGIFLEHIGTGSQSAYATIFDPKVEYTHYGIYHANSLGVNTIGGTVEGCSAYGIYHDTQSAECKTLYVDMEANTAGDVLMLGTRNEVTFCDTNNSVIIGAGSNGERVSHGRHNSIQIAATANDALIGPLFYNGVGLGGAWVDNGTRTRFAGPVIDVATKIAVVGSEIPKAPVTFQAPAATDVPLTLKGAASQTASLQEWKTSAGALVAAVAANGWLGIGTGAPGFHIDVLADRATIRATGIADAALSYYGYSSFGFGIHNAAAPVPTQDIFVFGGEGYYTNAGALSGASFYTYNTQTASYNMVVIDNNDIGMGGATIWGGGYLNGSVFFIGSADRNIGVNTITEFGSGDGVIGVADATAAPTTNPSAGYVQYSLGGKPKFRTASGVIGTPVAEYSDHNPTPTPGAGAFTTASCANGRYFTNGKQTAYQSKVILTNIGTGSGNIIVTLPINAAVACMVAIGFASTGQAATGIVSGGTLTIIPAAALANGQEYWFSFTYENV